MPMSQKQERSRTILQKLLERTKADEVSWEHGDDLFRGNRLIGRELFVNLPDSQISIGHFWPPDENEYVVASFCEPSGVIIDQWHSSSGTGDWDFALELAREAERVAVPSAPVLDDIERAISAEGTIGSRSRGADFLRKVAGEWNLSYERGGKMHPEELRLDEDGRYYLRKTPNSVCFTLENIQYEPDSQKVSFDKVDATPPRRGRIRQTELLTISDDFSSMEGIAADDGHKLVYTRAR